MPKKLQVINNSANQTLNKVLKNIYLGIIILTILAVIINFIGDLYWQVQQNLFLWLNSAGFLPNKFWLNLTFLGDGFVLLPFFGFLLFFKNKSWATIIASIPLAATLSIIGKNIMTMSRPASVLTNDSFIIIGDKISAYTSLPSGHSITVFTAFFALILTTTKIKNKNIWSSIALIIASFLAFSRIAVGAHWPFDVLTGAYIGYISALSGVYLVQKYNNYWKFMTLKKYYPLLSLLFLTWGYFLIIKNINYHLISIYLSAFSAITISIYLLYIRFYNVK